MRSGRRECETDVKGRVPVREHDALSSEPVNVRRPYSAVVATPKPWLRIPHVYEWRKRPGTMRLVRHRYRLDLDVKERKVASTRPKAMCAEASPTITISKQYQDVGRRVAADSSGEHRYCRSEQHRGKIVRSFRFFFCFVIMAGP